MTQPSNKCNNEKRRREQENIYIEELAELISANIADMSSLSVKPDKCAILQEAVNQIRSIKRAEAAAQAAQGGGANAVAMVTAQSGGGAAQPVAQQPAVAADPVQQGEVSSSRPTILSNEVYGPLLLEALEGFLFVVNSEGKVEHVTENVSTYIKFTREDVLGKSIYNFIHHGDHAKFHTNLLPMAIEWGGGGSGGTGSGDQQPPSGTRSRSIDIRLLVKPTEDTDETLEEKQQRVSFYELMHISSTQLKDNLSVSEEDGSDSGPCLLCVASRISHRDKISCSIEQFTTKLDTGGKVICVDTSGVSESVAQTIKKELKNRQLRELVLQQDLQKLNAHLRETVSTGQSTSALYRLQIGTDKYVQVQTKSKFFKTVPHATNDSDFIMATHSIISDNDSGVGPTDPGGGGGGTNTCTTPTPISAGGSVGGPLMTSVVNGTAGPAATAAPPPRTNSNGPPPDSSALLQFTLDSEFNLDFNFPTSSSWDLDGGWQTETATAPASVSRPSSRTNTPTTPTRQQGGGASGDPYASGQSQVQSSPFGGHQPLPSPVTNPATPASASSNHYPGSGGGFPFSPLTEQPFPPAEEQKDSKVGVLEEAAVMAAAVSSESTRLRNLLLKPSEDKNRDRILKELLKEEDDGMKNAGPRGLLGRAMVGGACETPKAVASGTGNNMLRQLLNEKSDEDDAESRAGGVKKKSELLQQLLKSERDAGGGDDDKREGGANGHGGGGGQCQDDTLLRSLGFPPSPGRKRQGEDKDDAGPAGKRHSDGSQVSSSGTGNSLQERNKLLATLLAKQPTNHQPIPPIPASVISATPQEKLPRITDPNKSIQMAMSQPQGATLNNRMGGMNRMGPGRPPQHSQQQQQQNYLNSVLAAAANRQLSQHQQCYSSPATSTTDGSATGWDSSGLGSPSVSASSAVAPSVLTANQAADPLLSEILEQVIDIVPDDLMHLLDGATGTTGISSDGQQLSLSETAAINMIQRSLMQCESVMVKTGQGGGGMATPPAYSTALGQQQGVFPPPPNYSQAKFQRMQMRTAAATGQPYPANITNQLLLQQQQRKQLLQQQQEHKRRLLLQQKQQQLLIPSNAAAAGEIGTMQNIDSLMNTTVAPNVSLQRSSSVPDQQLSPGYGTQRQQAQQQQQPYSPHSQLASPLGGAQFSGGGQSGAGAVVSQANAVAAAAAAAARLSPQAQFTAQLSPRGAYPQAATAVSWQQQQQRQQNPMLSAQLTRPPQQSQQQQQRALNSPYQADQFPPPASPTSAFGGQYLRLQRTNSAPTATTQLPGALGSPSGRCGGSYSSSPSSTPSSSSSREHPQQQQQQQQHQQHLPHHQPHPPHYPAPPPLASHPHPHNMYPHHPGEPPHNQYCHQQYHEQAAMAAAYNGGHHPAAPRPLHQGIPTSVSSAVQSQQQQAAAAVAAAAAAAAAAAGGPTSEFVRQELRAVVGARTQQQQQQQPTVRPQQQPPQQQPTVGDLESLGITFEMGGSDSPKLWGTMGSDMSSMSPPQHQAATSRTTMEEARQGDQKSSLLQKLLSE
ncbi:unnamed protein product [Acanthoscelides obtectus]|uniref:Nuclear receptor coactivator 2 n=1 Tax=Acanthoscelides obtectus TaxID=200917 RepID=A0A9P0P5B8_ACAOB|nr:unnamed protein product [Acanthoscelides obtectus]CAK1630629.1 Nuclear receptor coactivator 2 [Acanthoscelides obtectus]